MSSQTASKSDSSPPESTSTAPLALPEVAHNATQLDMSSGSTTFKLDQLGPMVVNVDGTISRITNWEALSEGEKKNALRIIAKRNQQRLEALKAEEKKS